ncbi:TonB-dependent receptor [Empedobacter falsenii]|uniref:TonB-dependent receptor n=1 Tax=Empedobacter falsenii TaxID=343874 RepID=UPI001C8E8543|nr:TonB-dependent receptor [Empedobacter falsenii]MBY0067287.1 TonB-dependent receptor [Empedobacter falsenii]
MKLNKFTLAILFSVCSIYGFSQEQHPVKGKIENAKNEAVGMAAIQIYKADSKELFDEVYANADGTFEIPDLEDGSYRLVITEFGYQQSVTTAEVKRGELNLGNIILQAEKAETVELKGAFVRAQTSQYRNEIDKRVVEVGNDLVSAGTDAASVLNNIPSVNVDQQSGALSLRGNENVKVYVDGKPSSQSAAQLLKQIPSNQIQRIEIITNPSAKYEADGKSGIINIVLVKGQKKGYNVGLIAGYEQGKKSRFNSSVNANVNVGKFNLFGNVNYADRPSKQNGIGQNYSDNIDQLFDIQNNKNRNLSYKAGFDWFINDQNALTVYTNQWNGDHNALINTNILQGVKNDLNRNDIWSDSKSSDYSLNFKHDFKKEDHNIILDAFYSTSKEDDDRDYTNTYPKSKFYQEYRNDKTTNTRINLDYTNQIKDAGKLEAGLQFRRETNDNILRSTDVITENAVNFNPNVDFEFERKFFSGYANYKQKFNKFGAQIGLRLERVEDDGNWLFAPNNSGTLKKDYTDLFPSAFLTYDLTEKDQLSFNYSRRIDRPGMYQLTPVPQFTTALMSSKGNPELNPEYTNSIELGYLKQLKKGSISGNLFYRHVTDNIIQTFKKDPEVESAFIQYNMNYDKVNSYGVEASWNYKLTKWMSTYLAGDFTSSEMQSVIEDENNNPVVKKITANTLSLRMNNTYTLTKQLSLQQFGFFRGKNKFLQGEMLDMWRMDLGIKYSFMQGKASFSARVNDIFNTMKARVNMDNPYEGFAKFKWESRTFYLGFNYNFGGKVKSRAEAQQNKTENQGGGIGLQ